MSSQDFLDGVLKAVSEALQPLAQALSSSASLTALLDELGWSSLTPAQFNEVNSSLQGVGSVLTAISTDSSDQLLTDIPSLITQLFTLSAGGSSGLTDLWKSLPVDLLDYLVCKYLESKSPLVLGVLSFLGVITSDPVGADTAGQPPRQAYTKVAVDWTVLPSVLGSPTQLFQTVYNWGGSSPDTFRYARFTSALSALLSGIGLKIATIAPSRSVLDLYYSSGSAERGLVRQVTATPFQIVDSSTGAQVVGKFLLALVPIPPDSDNTQPPDGFVVFPIVIGSASVDFSLFDGVDLSIQGGFSLSNPILLEVHPSGLNTRVNLASGASVSATVKLTAQSSPAMVLAGSKDSTHIEVSKAHFSLGVAGPDSSGDFEFVVEFGVDALAIFIDFGEGDGFLADLTGGGTSEIDLGFSAKWSSKKGFSFASGSTLELDLPSHLSLFGIVSLSEIYLGAQPDSTGQNAGLVAAVTGGLNLGPIAVQVQKVGLIISISPVDPSSSLPGILGKAAFTFGFKPPNGLGLAIDAGPVSGGGFISFDPTKGEYAGILVIDVDIPAATIGVTVIGLLDTKLPGGGSGYSFLLIVSGRFPPIQLGFGFTLDGVGGVFGINRSMDLDALRAAFKAHTLDSIFSPDPSESATEIIAKAPTIISALESIFPPTPDAFVFGPTVQLGWGTPGIIAAELGIIIELPDPIRLAILGFFTAALPSLEEEDDAIVLIHIDILGTIDFEKQQLAIDGNIHDSHVAAFDISGDMALRFQWGPNPQFAFSLGGFNPQFSPPSGFPTLQRITIALGDGSTSLSLTTYLALTANTAQVGADLELHASAAGFTVHGYLGFDALFIFQPFSFTVELKAGLDLLQGSSTIASIDLDLLLSGPKPWHAHGSASLHVLFISVSVTVDATVGDPAALLALPLVAVLPLLAAALIAPPNWKAEVSATAGASVSLANPPSGDQTILVHPRGFLSVVQNAVPLQLQMDKYGNGTPSDTTFVQILHAGITVNGSAIDSADVSDVNAMFALGQYKNYSDAEKLSLPSFQPVAGGVEIGSTDVQFGPAANLQRGYTTYYIEDPLIPARVAPATYVLDAIRQSAFIAVAAAGFQGPQAMGSGKYVEPATAPVVQIQPQGFVVASTSDLSVSPTISPAGPTSQVLAQQALDQHLTAHPEDRGQYQVVSVAETQAT